jgi:[protein-PII] uridylyltransferase
MGLLRETGEPESLLAAVRTASREERVRAAQAYVRWVRDDVRRRHEAQSGVEGGRALAQIHSHALEKLVVALYEAASSERQGDVPPVALCATGGFGRGELSPYSDLDLVFLHASPRAAEVAVGQWAEQVLYPLWDCRLEIGHAVRDVTETIELAREDLTACTALLDTRYLAGDAPLAISLREETERAILGGGVNDLVARLTTEKAARHDRFGDTVYQLEPNLKNGRGGLRDLYSGLWAARARWRISRLEDLVAIGAATPRQVQALTAAQDVLLRLRAAAHLHARRRQDQLLFEVQEAIAPVLFPDVHVQEGEIRPAVAPAVEALMQRYFQCAKTINLETDRLLERAVVPPPRKPSIRRVDASFSLFNGQLTINEPDLLRERPAEIVRLHATALDLGVPIYAHARELVAEAAGDEAIALRLRSDPAASRWFLSLLTDLRDARRPSILESLHDLGVVNAVLPEWQPCTGRVQHDLYHVFTVDQHQLYAVARLKAIARGELEQEFPVVTAAYGQVKRKAPLYLGTLLHDVGKPHGKGHSEKGARLIVEVARRLGLSPDDVAQAEFLVRNHLLMAHLSQRRDLHDAGMIADFAAQVGDEETLRELYLLTFADMSMVAPGNLTSWKEALLRELYVRTQAYLRRGPDLAGLDQSRVVARRRTRVGQLLGKGRPEEEAALAEFFEGLPDRYFLATPPRAMVRHYRLRRERISGESQRRVALAVDPRPRRGYIEVSLVASDAPGLLAAVTGVFLAHRLDILGAEVVSRVAAPSAGEALDIFYVKDRGIGGREEPDRWRRIADDLEEVLAGRASVEDLIAARRERSGLPARVTPSVPTEIELDNEVSERFTVLDVYTQDRTGVLHVITRTLSRLGLDIVLSKVATEGDRVADVFYVRGPDGAKVTGELELERIRVSLTEALSKLSEEAR